MSGGLHRIWIAGQMAIRPGSPSLSDFVWVESLDQSVSSAVADDATPFSAHPNPV
jgi:hypothetical protein